jgi:hypothetical protein
MPKINPNDGSVNADRIAAIIRNTECPYCVECKKRFKRASQVWASGALIEPWGIAVYQLCRQCAPLQADPAWRTQLEFEATAKAKGASTAGHA